MPRTKKSAQSAEIAVEADPAAAPAEVAEAVEKPRAKKRAAKPAKPSKPSRPAPWIDYKPKEVEDLVMKLAKKKHSSSGIGIILRDQYGVPSVKSITKKTVVQILKENNAYQEIPEDMFNLLKKAVNLMKHLEKNKRDYHSKRGLQMTESKIRSLAKYYISKGTLPKSWIYDPEKAKLLMK
jgi:small subunit ribosomal protein S15